jgi:hypothetical protein
MPPATASGWLRSAVCPDICPPAGRPSWGGPVPRGDNCLTAQHNTYPGVRLPCADGVRHKRKPHWSRGKPLQASAIAGDHTTVRVVTGEIPVRFTRCIPPDGRHDTFDRKYPALTVRLHGLMSGSLLPARLPVRAQDAGGRTVNQCNRVAVAVPERRANRRGAAPGVGGGRYPSNVAAPACRTFFREESRRPCHRLPKPSGRRQS